MKDCGFIHDCDHDVDVSLCDFCADKIIVARKSHVCGECNAIIAPGEKYRRIVGKHDGELTTTKLCNDCNSVVRAFFDCFTVGNIWEAMGRHVFDMDGEINPYLLARLTLVARGKMCEKIEDYWETILR